MLKKPKTDKEILKQKSSKHKIIPVSFPVVAIGSSVGGLKAASVLFRNLSPDTGMAFIYVQHLSPNHKSLLTTILSKITAMKVQEIEDMEQMLPNNVYIIPNDRGIEVTNGHIKLIPRSEGTSAVSIDILFSSLAETHHENVIGIVLSGNAHDGTEGLKDIKEAGGITFAQDNSAQADSMPRSAINSGAVDFILSPKDIALQLNRLSRTGLKSFSVKHAIKGILIAEKEVNIEDNNSDLRTILEILHREINVDFSLYKMATIKRRINHRMLQCGLKTIKEYAKFILKKNQEVDLLYKDLLINITSFFRDEETFKYLKNTFLPALLKDKAQNGTLRIWIPACSTGEEVYTIAILIAELQSHKLNKIPVQIFATDLSDQAIRDARMGEYAETDMKSVGKKRTELFFTKTGNRYRVIKEIREMCVFAPHNILYNPPFSHIDFISCRNLLIYFDATAQKKAIATMHFALNDGGHLLLGKSETVGTSSLLFNALSSTFKLYSRKKSEGISKVPDLAPRFQVKSVTEKSIKILSRKTNSVTSSELDQTIDSTLLSLYMPACVVINKTMEIIKFRGLTSAYLSHPTGNASLNILKMTRPEFVFELRNAIIEVIKTSNPVSKSGIQLNPDKNELFSRVISLEVRPLAIEWGEPLYLIVFAMHETEQIAEQSTAKNNLTPKDFRIKKQIEELHKASAEMSSLIESQDRAYEELQAANEEIISVSEEFQTLNEELETSKEEIEATNEELLTTNQELQMRNEQLAESYNFSEAVAETMHEPMIILDKYLRIKSANTAFYKKFHIMQTGTEGMLLFELSNNQWDIPSLRELLDNIIQKNTHFYEHEISYTFPGEGKKTMLLNARRIAQKSQNEELILLTFTDTTEIITKRKSDNKRLEAVISQRTAALEESYKIVREKNVFLEKTNRELETFTFVSSHDLQEPLRKIQMFTSCLLDEESENLSVTGKEYLAKVHTTVDRMQLLINDLMVYAGVKEGTHEFEKTDLNQIVNEVIEEFQDTIRAKKAIITATGICHSKVIVFQFRQVIHNLVANSLKFSHAKRFPRIALKCEITPGRLLHFDQLLPEVNYCHISVTDNGIGFDPLYKDRIFTVFQRLNEQTAYAGSGIGLAICKRIVENHKGMIIATGKLNKGAQFDIYIPAS